MKLYKKIHIQKKLIILIFFSFPFSLNCREQTTIAYISNIYFQKNSLEYNTEILKLLNNSYRGNSFDLLADLLIYHTDLKGIVVCGNQGKYENRKGLSFERAQKVKSELMKRGVKEDRFSIRDMGSSSPEISKDSINKVESDSIKKFLIERNYRVDFLVR